MEKSSGLKGANISSAMVQRMDVEEAAAEDTDAAEVSMRPRRQAKQINKNGEFE